MVTCYAFHLFFYLPNPSTVELAIQGSQEVYAGWNNQHNIHLVCCTSRGLNPWPLERESSALTKRPWHHLFTPSIFQTLNNFVLENINVNEVTSNVKPRRYNNIQKIALKTFSNTKSHRTCNSRIFFVFFEVFKSKQFVFHIQGCFVVIFFPKKLKRQICTIAFFVFSSVILFFESCICFFSFKMFCFLLLWVQRMMRLIVAAKNTFPINDINVNKN